MPDYAGNNLLSAREISSATGSQIFSDRVDTLDTDDYYRINLSGRSSLSLAVNGLSANANLQLLDRNGNTLQSSTNSAGIAESISQVLDANVYYIRVFQSSGAETDYSLNLKLQNGSKTDIYWRDYSSGSNAVWFMGGTNNTTIASSTYLTSLPTNWHLEATADFNGDKRPDLLWRDYSSGSNAVWFMGGTNNTTIASSTYLTSLPTNWHLEATADFNGDNRPDLLWRDYSSGSNAVWFMGGTNNTTIASSTYLTSLPTNWQLEATADFNGDSRPDLLWRDYSSGSNAVWFMGGTNNTTIASSTYLTSLPTNWHLEGTADFNGDNRPDLLWRDYSSGSNAVWFMGGTNNTTIASSTYLTSLPTNWQAIPSTHYEEPLPIDLAGNSTNTAFDIGTLSGSGVFSDRLDSTDPNDYYQFTLSSASSVNLSLNGLSANADIQLLSSSGTVLQGSYNSGSSAESVSTTLSTGTYYVRVYQTSGSTNYSLNLSATTSSANLYYFTYAYGNGDSYQGYGYTTTTSYSSGKYLYDSAANETGNKGYYYISSTYTGYSASYNNQVYVYSYYNSENSTSYTPYSGYGSNGLGSEYGYLTSAQTAANDYFGGRYYEADVPSATTIDLKGSSFSLTSTSLTAGNTVTANFGLQNTGNGNAGSFNIKFYLSTDSTINTNDKYLDAYTVSALSANTSTTLSKALTLPGATDAFWSGSKTYYIGMIVDADSSISESNETNNSNTGVGWDYKDTYVTIPATSFVSISNLVFSGKEGDTGTFSVSLKQAISANVTLTFNAGKFLTIDADGIVSDGTQNTITFTPTDWNQSRSVWFIAEDDDTSANRSSGNTLGYTLSGGLNSSGSYDLGTISNTYAPDYSRFNIDLDFRNDTQNFWTSARRTVAQRAANDWANVIVNELNGVTFSNQRLGMVGVNGMSAFTFTTNRYIDDLIIFVGSYNGGDNAAGWGGSYAELGGWTTSEPLPRGGEFTVNAAVAATYSDSDLYSVFCHEIGHALGLLGQDKTSADLIDQSTPQTAVFKGEYSRIANGGSYIPLQSQDGPNPVTGEYDYSHPANRIYSMMSYGYTYQLSAPTNIDFALLADAGYRVKGVNA